MTEETLAQYKSGTENRIIDLLGDLEATTGTRIDSIEMKTEWVDGIDGPEIRKRTVTINFIKP